VLRILHKPSDVDLSKVSVSATKDLLVSSDDADSVFTSTTAYTLLKELIAPFSGYYYVEWASIPGGNTPAVYTKIYKNGSAYGTEFLNNQPSWVTHSDTLYFTAGDSVQLYGYGILGGNFTVKNFRLYVDRNAKIVW